MNFSKGAKSCGSLSNQASLQNIRNSQGIILFRKYKKNFRDVFFFNFRVGVGNCARPVHIPLLSCVVCLLHYDINLRERYTALKVLISIFKPNTRKYGPEKTMYLHTFHEVIFNRILNETLLSSTHNQTWYFNQEPPIFQLLATKL